MPKNTSSVTMRTRTLVDAVVVSSAARRMATNAGFDRRACVEIGIAVSELATNAVRHASGSGELQITYANEVLDVVCTDEGDGSVDVLRAALLRDRPQPARGGLGCGLGAVRRLMDEVSIGARDGGGLWVRAWRSRRLRGEGA